MTRDDIIRMAREAGWSTFDLIDVERFAALVAAAERNRMISEGWRQCAQGQRTTQHCAVADRLARHGIQIPEDEEYGNPSF
jgi:hypothetical protein